MTSPTLLRWHRLFGIALTDFFTGTPWRVELEKELSLKSQLLDVAIIEQTESASNSGPAALDLPDGLEDLRRHNLLTFKSRREALTDWTLNELIGHYVNYRKLISPADQWLPDDQFGLYAVATRSPDGLSGHDLQAVPGKPGVFDIPWFSRHIRLIVINEVGDRPQNALWDLFGTRIEQIRRGAAGYRFRRRDAGRLFDILYLARQLERPEMPYTMEDFIREAEDMIRTMPPEQRRPFIENATVEERLEGLAAEERLKGLGVEERLQGLGVQERLKGLAAEDLLRGLNREDRIRLKKILDEETY